MARSGNQFWCIAICKKWQECPYAKASALPMPWLHNVVGDQSVVRSQEAINSFGKHRRRIWVGIIHQDALPLPNGQGKGTEIGKLAQTEGKHMP